MQDSSKVWELLAVNNRLYSTLLQQELSRFGLTMPQIAVIEAVKYGAKTIGEIARAVDLSNSTVSGIVDRLEKNRLATRHRDGKDRRVVLVKLTKAGLDIVSESHSDLQEMFGKSMLRDLSQWEIAEMEKSLYLVSLLLQNTNHKPEKKWAVSR